MTEPITTDAIVDRYDAVLLDAYGVLVHSQGAFDGAAEFLEKLRDSGTDYLVVTNDASRLPETCAKRYARDGISVEPDRVLTSGQLVVPHLQQQGLNEVPVAVLGTDDSKAHLTRAGYPLVEPGDDRTRALVIGDEAGYDFVPTIEQTLSMLVRAMDQGRPVELVCPNPDRLYPSGPDTVGFTAGAIAALIEDALRSRHRGREIEFARLGKPHPALYRQALERLGTDNAVMIGDQLATDIRGAHEIGIDSVLVTAGISGEIAADDELEVRPTYVMDSLEG